MCLVLCDVSHRVDKYCYTVHFTTLSCFFPINYSVVSHLHFEQGVLPVSVHQIVGLPRPCDIRIQVVRTLGTNMCVCFQDRYTVDKRCQNAKETIITSA